MLELINGSEHKIKAFVDGNMILSGPANIIVRKNSIGISNLYTFLEFDKKKNFNNNTKRFEKKFKNHTFELEIIKN